MFSELETDHKETTQDYFREVLFFFFGGGGVTRYMKEREKKRGCDEFQIDIK